MQPVYLLLRSNQQSGPHTLEELVRFNLKASDLIWIEGKSAGWYYPQELQALHPYLTFLQRKAETPTPAVANPTTSSTAGKKIFVAMPDKPWQSTATPASGSYTAVAPQPSLPTPLKEAVTETELKTTYTKSLEEVETDYTNWMYEKKRKQPASFPKKAALAACLLGVAAVAGWWLLKPTNDLPTVATPSIANPITTTENAAAAITDEEPTIQSTRALPVVAKKGTANKEIAVAKKAAKVDERVKANEGLLPPVNDPKEEAAPVFEEPTASSNDEAKPVVTEVPEEKKKLRDKILDLFKKKPEEAKPAETEEGRRQSTRREAGSNLAQMVTVRLTIPNDWMMGIKGAKATLTNRSSETIANASVEVVYYNDDNEVLTKRTIAFTNIKSKGTATVAIPDHQTATRLEYQVLSAVGTGEPLARR